MNPCLWIQQWVCCEKKTFIISKCSILYLLLHHYIWPLSDSQRVSLRFASALSFSFFVIFLVEVLETKRCFSHERSQLWENNCKLLKWCWAAERGGVKWECFRNFTMSRNSVQNPFLFEWKRRVLGYDEVLSFLENGAVFKPFEGGAWISSGVVMLFELPEMIITIFFLFLYMSGKNLSLLCRPSSSPTHLSILRRVKAVLCHLYMWHFTLWHYEYKETFIAADFQGSNKLYKAISLKNIHQDLIKPWRSTTSDPVGSN